MNPISLTLPALLLGLFLLGGEDSFTRGVQEFRAGRFEKAYALLREAEKASKAEEMPTPLLVDLALAASKTQRFEEASGYAERAAAREKDLSYLRDQVVGATRLTAAEKGGAAKDPRKLDEALAEVRRAIEAFGSAILARPDAMEARRNLERALKLLKELEKKKKEAEDKKKKEDEKKKKQDKKNKKNKDKQKKDKQKKQKDKGKKDKQKKDKQKKQQDENKKNKQKKDQQKKEKDKKKQEQSQASQPKQEKGKQEKRELSAEEKKRLETILKQAQKELLQLKKSRIPRHQPGKKDW